MVRWLRHATAARLNLTWEDELSGRDDERNEVDRALDSPAAIKILVNESVHRWICRQVDADVPLLGCGSAGPETSAFKKLIKKPPATAPCKWRTE